MMQSHDTILIVDFGSQVTQLIARRVREEGVYSEIVPFDKAEEAFRRLNPKGVILSGSPASVTAENSPRAPQAVFRGDAPGGGRRRAAPGPGRRACGRCWAGAPASRPWRCGSAARSGAGTTPSSAGPRSRSW